MRVALLGSSANQTNVDRLPLGHDLRLLVTARCVVGAVERVSAPGEWRTNVSLGVTVRSMQPAAEACELAPAAAHVVSADFVGVDLLPVDARGYVVLELNGAVDFLPEYGLNGGDVYADVAAPLGLIEEEEDAVLDAHRVAGPA